MIDIDDLSPVQLSLVYLYLKGFTKFSFNTITNCWILSAPPVNGYHIAACAIVHCQSGYFLSAEQTLSIMQEENISLRWDTSNKHPRLTIEALPEIFVCDKNITKALKQVIILKELFISQRTLAEVLDNVNSQIKSCMTFATFDTSKI